MDGELLKLIPEMGSPALAAVLMFWALRYVITSTDRRAQADRELFKDQFDSMRATFQEVSRSNREAHEREIRELTIDFKECIRQTTQSQADLTSEIRRLRSASNAH